jgi:DMSO/TMAO reductase YedYZ molybdopterin-dependent catalytic subunit
MGKKLGAIIILFILLSALMLSCSEGVGTYQGETEKSELNEARELESVEIREYEGEKLSSVYDFRNNAIRGTQHIDIDSYMLNISGLVSSPQSYDYDQIINNYQNYKKVVELNCVEGWSATVLWEGLLLRELLSEAKPLPEAKTVIFHASDDYTTSFPIEYIMDNDIIMAYKMNGYPLIPERGYPFTLVAENKWGYKWIKWITKIELSDDVNYKGFWESGGYSNSGDLDKDFFD